MDIIVTFMFDSFFQFSRKVQILIFLLAFFQFSSKIIIIIIIIIIAVFIIAVFIVGRAGDNDDDFMLTNLNASDKWNEQA